MLLISFKQLTLGTLVPMVDKIIERPTGRYDFNKLMNITIRNGAITNYKTI